MGGMSSEREISLRTGTAVYQALLTRGVKATPVDVDHHVAERLVQLKPDLCFIALHGRYGEDGCIQGLLEVLQLPYTGSGVLASAIAMNKTVTKQMFQSKQLPTPAYLELAASTCLQAGWPITIQQVQTKLKLPLVVKVPNQGSSIGVFFVHLWEELQPAIQQAFRYEPLVLLESMIAGRELTAAILGNDDPQILPLIEIQSKTGAYDYHAKYTPGMSDHLVPAALPPQVETQVKQVALGAYQALGCCGFARVDIMLDNDGQPWLLEVNTVPGMTSTSLFPDAARAAGIEFAELVEQIINLALSSRLKANNT